MQMSARRRRAVMMRDPTRWGMSEVRTVSTSGSSGMDIILRSRAAGFEEGTQEITTFLSEYAGDGLYAVVKAWIGEEVAE